MYLDALATANPPHSFTQRECWEAIARSETRHRLQDRSLALLRKILLGENGISTRQFALADLDRVFDYNADDLSKAFEREAPRLAGAALLRALEEAGLRAIELDALFVCTCTGYLCPGVSSHVAEQLGLRPDAFLHDAVGLGCGAAIPTMRAASHFLAAHPEAKVACVAVEVCSAAFYLDDDPGVLISACLFGDGAAAAIWSGKNGKGPRVFGFDTVHVPEQREILRFETKNGQLRNRLAKAVPARAAEAVRHLFQRQEHAPPPALHTIAHPGGRDVLNALSEVLPGQTLEESRRVLQRHGNMSSPSVLFALKEFLHGEEAGKCDDLWLVSFGAGFSCHSCRLSR